MKIFNTEISKVQLMEKIGDITHIGGMKSYVLEDGAGRGIRAIDMKSPCGTDVTVLLDRGMDISSFFYKSIPIHWRSLTKETSPFLYDSRGDEWLRSFYGGLLTTCGLTYNGWPCVDNNEELGMHGRISNLLAENVSYDGEWEEDSYIMWVKGKIREVKFFDNKLILKRKIKTRMDKPVIDIEDTIENIGAEKSPLMFLYHINIGFPILDERSKLVGDIVETKPGNDAAKNEKIEYFKFVKPQDKWEDQLFFHDIRADKDGYSNIAIINEKFNLDEGLGIWIRFNKKTLPCMTQWKKMGKYGDYVCGIEPGTNYVSSRKIERDKGTLKFINPSEKAKFKIQIRILENNEKIMKFKKLYGK